MTWTVSYVKGGNSWLETWYAQKSVYCRSPPEKIVCVDMTKGEALALLSLKGDPSVIIADEVYSTEVESNCSPPY